MFSPLKHWGADKGGKRVGIVGIGGLGQMGIRLAKAMGNEVTAISTSPNKEEAAKKIGATNFVVSTNEESMKAATASLDLILNTVSANHNCMMYIPLLRTNGVLVQLGLVTQPHEVFNNNITTAAAAAAAASTTTATTTTITTKQATSHHIETLSICNFFSDSPNGSYDG